MRARVAYGVEYGQDHARARGGTIKIEPELKPFERQQRMAANEGVVRMQAGANRRRGVAQGRDHFRGKAQRRRAEPAGVEDCAVADRRLRLRVRDELRPDGRSRRPHEPAFRLPGAPPAEHPAIGAACRGASPLLAIPAPAASITAAPAISMLRTN
jgi:hypothetical protein